PPASLAHFLRKPPRPTPMSAAIGAAFFDRPQPQSDGVVTDLRREILLTRVAIAITLLASAGVVAVTLRPTLELSSLGVGAAVRRVLFLVIVLFLLYGGAIYQLPVWATFVACSSIVAPVPRSFRA